MGCVVYLYLTGFWQASGGANGRRVTGWGRVGAQQVEEGGRYISASAQVVEMGKVYKCLCTGCGNGAGI